MSNKHVGKWGYSKDGELYTGRFDSREEAVAEATELGWRYIGQYREAAQPEEFVDAAILLEHIACQDEYCGDWAEGWPFTTQEQEDELTLAIRQVLGEWLDKHDLRPEWGMVENAEDISARLRELEGVRKGGGR